MNLPTSSSAGAVISVAGLSRRFGTKPVLEDVSIHVPRGCVFGLLGENGAGKSTLIKHLLGLLRVEAGAVRVFGLDPVAQGVEVLSRIGYLSEARDLPSWMRVDELLRYSAAFYPGWDHVYADELRRQFELETKVRVRHLSQGQLAKAGLLVALAHRPELLILDEPSSGLDPVVRRDILEAIIRTVADEGRTVFFSSHLLDEVERVSDQIAMIHRGRVVLGGTLSDIKERHVCLVVRFPAPRLEIPSLENVVHLQGADREWSIMCQGARGPLEASLAKLGGEVVEERVPTLDEIFVAQATGAGGMAR